MMSKIPSTTECVSINHDTIIRTRIIITNESMFHNDIYCNDVANCKHSNCNNHSILNKATEHMVSHMVSHVEHIVSHWQGLHPPTNHDKNLIVKANPFRKA